MTTTDFSETDLFRDQELPKDPYPFYDWVREHGPIWYYPLWDVWLVTGYEEATSIYRDQADVVELQHGERAVQEDVGAARGRRHHRRSSRSTATSCRSATSSPRSTRRSTPRTAGCSCGSSRPSGSRRTRRSSGRSPIETIDTVHRRRASASSCTTTRCPYTLMVIADLLGVPDDDRDAFLEHLTTKVRAARMEHKPLGFLYEQFTRYIEDRRAHPRDDVMTEMAQATFPDGTLPPVEDVMRISANLFSAGSETTARLIGMCAADPRRSPRVPAAAARRPRPHRAVRRGDAAHRGAAQGLVQAGQGAHDGGRCRARRRGRRCS